MTTYYVATTGSDSGAGSATSPWRTISKAMKASLKSGDEVVVRSGTYNEGVIVNKDGITLRSEVPGGANIVPPPAKLGININADHVTIKGFEVFGSTTAGITGNGVHHVEVLDNIVHDNDGNGILLMKSDFITVDSNVVYNNASMGARSGISIFNPIAVAGYGAEFRIIVRNNVSHHNQNESGMHTDGAGIILDDFNAGAYKFPVLVENNLVYQNGGAGILVYKSSNATIRKNAAWHNQLDTHSTRGTWRTELQTQAADNITWVNNTAVADWTVSQYNAGIGSFSFPGDTNTGIIWLGNTTFDGRSGDASVSTNGGNAGPSAALNKLGVNPGLDFADILSLAKSLGASGVPDVDGGTDSPDDGGPQTPGPTTPPPSADLAALATPQSPAFYAELARKSAMTLKTGIGDAGDNLVLVSANGVARGNDGDDILVGDNRGNTLYGGAGDNVLAGLGGADVFYFAGGQVRGTKVDTILDLDFAEKDVIVLRGYDQGTFAAAPGLAVFDGGGSATIDSLADLRALVAKSADVTSRSGGGGTEVLRIVQDGSVHEIRLDGYDHLL
jgi:parallel beta-helix repeat protein